MLGGESILMYVIITDYDQRAADIRAIRDEVFVIEQHVSPELEIDDRDSICPHAVAYLREGKPVGCGRLDLEKSGKIGRVAVLAEYRRGGAGTAIMACLEEHALLHSELTSVWCHAQLQAVPFYLRLGYQVCGEEFEEAGIAHVRMQKSLARAS